MITLLHVSDPHLDDGSRRTDRLRSVLAAAASRSPDAIIATGDITDHGLATELATFEGVMQQQGPWVAVPGNHDRPGAPGEGHATFPDVATLDLADGVRIVGLDVTVPGEDHGHLREDVARQALEAAAGAERVLLAFHQPPIATGHPYADTMLLDNPDALTDLVRELPPVVAILCGHVHHGVSGRLGATPVIAAPSTHSLLGLDPATRPLANSDAPPGFALHRLGPWGITSTFHYVT